MRPNRIFRQTIGDLLIERRLINREQLDKAFKQQIENGGYISQHLISLGFVSEKDIAECFAAQYGFAYLPIANYTLTPDVLELISFNFMDMYSLLPVARMGNVLSVAMADPLNDGVIDMLKQITKCDIQVFISTYNEIREAIEEKRPFQILGMNDDDNGKMALLKKDILPPFIQDEGFDPKREQRKYKRFEVDFGIVYYLRDQSYRGIVKDISYNGIMFTTDLAIPIDKTIYGIISLPQIEISVVLQVLRVETHIKSAEADPSSKKAQKYNIPCFFNFLTYEDKETLPPFLTN